MGSCRQIDELKARCARPIWPASERAVAAWRDMRPSEAWG